MTARLDQVSADAHGQDRRKPPPPGSLRSSGEAVRRRDGRHAGDDEVDVPEFVPRD
ncbi:MAG: hypothetical protein ACYCUM_11595 [Solirubrobacteraceae bacterium]